MPGCPFASVGCELSTQDEVIRLKVQEMFDRMCRYLENALRDAHREGLIEKQDFPGNARAVFSLIIGMLVQAKVRNDAEVLREISPAMIQMIHYRPGG